VERHHVVITTIPPKGDRVMNQAKERLYMICLGESKEASQQGDVQGDCSSMCVFEKLCSSFITVKNAEFGCKKEWLLLSQSLDFLQMIEFPI